MVSAFHQLCPRYSGTLTPTAPMAIMAMENLYLSFLPLKFAIYIAGTLVGDLSGCTFTFNLILRISMSQKIYYL